MPVGELIAQAVAQAVMEGGGEVIRQRFGKRGCALIVGSAISVIALAVWLLS